MEPVLAPRSIWSQAIILTGTSRDTPTPTLGMGELRPGWSVQWQGPASQSFTRMSRTGEHPWHDAGVHTVWLWSCWLTRQSLSACECECVHMHVCACVCVHACVLPSINGSSLEWETLSLVISRISLSSVLLNVYWALISHASALSLCSFEAELGVLCVINKNKMMRQ